MKMRRAIPVSEASITTVWLIGKNEKAKLSLFAVHCCDFLRKQHPGNEKGGRQSLLLVKEI